MIKGIIYVVTKSRGDGYHLRGIDLLAWFTDKNEACEWAGEYDKRHNCCTDVETVEFGTEALLDFVEEE